jgi:hypothetical protein
MVLWSHRLEQAQQSSAPGRDCVCLAPTSVDGNIDSVFVYVCVCMCIFNVWERVTVIAEKRNVCGVREKRSLCVLFMV